MNKLDGRNLRSTKSQKLIIDAVIKFYLELFVFILFRHVFYSVKGFRFWSNGVEIINCYGLKVFSS